MARTTKLVALTNFGLLRAAARPVYQRHFMSQFAAVHYLECDQELESELNGIEMEQKKHKNMVMDVNWVPHPRSGIYFPEGQDRVMDGVPYDAASLGQGQTYWIRNIDGVEKHDPDVPSADHYLLSPHRHP